MANPTRMRTEITGSKVIVRALMSHPMETGQRKDSLGKIVPAWFITTVRVTHNGNEVMTAQWGPAVASNPFLQFTLKSGKAGDKVAIAWVDNKGDSRSDEVVVS